MRDNIKEYLEEKIRIYNKNSKALADMLTLNDYLCKDPNCDDLAFWTLADTFIKNLEDPEVDIPLETDSLIVTVLKNEIRKNNELINLIKEMGYDDLTEKLKKDFRINQLFKSPITSQKLDILLEFWQKSSKWTQEILTSNMKTSKKVHFLNKMLLNCNSLWQFEFIIEFLGDGLYKNCIQRSTDENNCNKVKELIEAFKKSDINVQDLFNYIYFKCTIKDKASAIKLIVFLQKKGLVDFTNLRLTSDCNTKEFSISAILFEQNSIEYFNEFRNLEEYKKTSQDIKDNDDEYLIYKIDERDIGKLISLSSFIITEEKIRLIAIKVLELQKEDKFYGVKTNLRIIENIKYAILRKAKNKNEYKKMVEYVALFEKESDYKTIIQKEKQEKIELANARLQLINRLYNMTDSLNEQVPGKTIIRKLNFKR